MEIRHFTTQAACSCPHWRYRPHRRPCKHVEGIRSALTLLQAQDAHNGLRMGMETTGALTVSVGESSEGGVANMQTLVVGAAS